MDSSYFVDFNCQSCLLTIFSIQFKFETTMVAMETS